METKEQGFFQKLKLKLSRRAVIAVAAVLLLLLAVAVGIVVKKVTTKKTLPLSSSSLKQIINIEELSTYEITYGGVAVGLNEKKPDEMVYCVRYEAVVKLGINLKNAQIEVDDEAKAIRIRIPEAEMTSSELNILDRMVYNEKEYKNVSLQQEMNLCAEDVKTECAESKSLWEIADKNAKEAIRGLVKPLLKGTGYSLDLG